MQGKLQRGLMAALLCFSGLSAASEQVDPRGYAGIGASRFAFKEDDMQDAEPLAATIFTGVELHRFLDIQAQISVQAKPDKYAEDMSLLLHDYTDRTLDISSVGAASVKTEMPLTAGFFVKPKLALGPAQLYVLGGVTYFKLEQKISGSFDGTLYDSTGAIGTFANAPFDLQFEREGIALSYGAGLAFNLGRLRLQGEYVRLDKRDATNHSCHSTGVVGTTEVIYCDDLFNASVLDMATVGLAINF